MNYTPELKKAELHCHIEGAARPELVRKIAERNGLSDTVNEIFDSDGNYRWHDFVSFLDNYEKSMQVFRTPDDFTELAYDYYKSSAECGSIYTEIFISPDLAETTGLSYAEYTEALAQGFFRARRETGIEGVMIAVGIRHFGPEFVEKAAQTVIDNPHPFVTGFGMAGDENQHEIEDFANAFSIAKAGGLKLTCHAGEHRGAADVRKAVETYGLKRVGHGVRAIEDPAVLDFVIENEITLEVCPSSNVYMGLFDNIAMHSVHELMEMGAKVTVSTDDPPHFHTDIRKEYEALNWSIEQLNRITRNSIEAAFCDEITRQGLLLKLER